MAVKENKAKAKAAPEEEQVLPEAPTPEEEQGLPEATAQTGAESKPKTEKEQPGAVTSAGFSVYLGPNIPGLIQARTIYPVGREAALALPEVQAAVAKKPGIAALLVDGLTLPEDRILVKTKGTALAKAYAAVLH